MRLAPSTPPRDGDAQPRRWRSGLRLLGATAFAIVGAWLLAACHGGPHTDFTVDTLLDTPDHDIGDGVCADPDGRCSLRAAVEEATVATDVQILVPEGTYTLSAGPLVIAPNSPLLMVREGDGVSVNANGASYVAIAGDVSIAGIGFTSTAAPVLRVSPGAQLSMFGSSVHGGPGAGIKVQPDASAWLHATTVSSNGKAGIVNDGSLALRSSTVTANAGGGVTGSAPFTAAGSIIADQTAGPDCEVAGISDGFNLSSDTTCGFTNDSDLEATPALLEPLSNTLVPFHLPRSISPVVDSIPVDEGTCIPETVLPGKRGRPRPIGAACDRGSVEVGFVLVDETDFTAIPPGSLPPEWVDCATAWPQEYAPLGVDAGGLHIAHAYAAVSREEAAKGEGPAIGCAWKQYGEGYGADLFVEVVWNEVLPLEGTPLLHVVGGAGEATPEVDELGVGAWPAHAHLWGECCMLIGGYIGHPPETFHYIDNGVALFTPTRRARRIAVRTDGAEVTMWMSDTATSPLRMLAGPSQLPLDLRGSTAHGLALDAHYATPEYTTAYPIEPMPSPEHPVIETHRVWKFTTG